MTNDNSKTGEPDIATAQTHADSVMAQYVHQAQTLLATRPQATTVMVFHEMMMTEMLATVGQVAMQIGAPPEQVFAKLAQAASTRALNALSGEQTKDPYKSSRIIMPGGNS